MSGRRDPAKYARDVDAIVASAVLSDDEIKRVCAEVPKPMPRRIRAHKYARVWQPKVGNE